MTALDQLPALVDRVRRELELARFIGKLVVDRGVHEARARLDDALSVASVDATDVVPPAIDDGPEPDEVERPDAAELALSDYDQLPSAHIVAKLDGLDERERDAIERYERAGRHRRTILGKLERIRQETAP